MHYTLKICEEIPLRHRTQLEKYRTKSLIPWLAIMCGVLGGGGPIQH